MRIRSFRNEKQNQYYFKVFNSIDEQVLKSEAYEAKVGRDNGINSFKKNASIPERYERLTSKDGKFYFNVKAANHQIVATSLMLDSEEKRESVIAEIIAYATSAGGNESTNPEAQNLAASPDSIDKNSGSNTEKALDDYQDLSFYEDSGTDTNSGFDRFQKGNENYYYFSFKSDDGKVILISQGYKADAGRENGIASVEKNGKIEKRYAHHTLDEGKLFFTLKAGNHQEIARSCVFDSLAEMKKGIAILMNGGGMMIEPAMDKATAKSSKDGMDDYRTFGFYKDSGTNVENGWDRFYSEKNNEYYFSYKVDGEPVLISEGYTTEASRENGIASVEKNWSINKRYKHHQTPGGRYYYTIRAGNHQEIARSKWYSSAEDRDRGVNWLLAGGIAGASAINLAATTPAVEKVIEKSVEVEDDYLPCKDYEGHEVNDTINNVAFFKHEDGQFYFVVYKSDGNVRLRSEGFETAKGRDEELSGVLKNLDNEEMYETVTRGKYSMYILRDKTGREVGRSCLEKEEEKVAAIPVAEAIAATAVAAAVTTEVAPEVTQEKEDDYLACKEYQGHEVNDTVNNVAFFKHENGQFYFVIYKEDGSVRLRSEGFEKAKTRDVELSGVLKNLDNPEMYNTLSKGKYSIHILSDATGREVGRSCLETMEEKVVAPPVVEAAAATAIATAIAAATEPEIVIPGEPDKEDDYLPCEEYENKKVSDKKNNVAFFKHSDGQLYFVIYKSDGTVRLRSEGFRNARERDSELSGALRNLENADMYETVTRGKYSLHILKDETGREVGRSCLETESNPLAIPLVLGAAAAAAAVAAVIPDPVIVVEEEVITPVAPVVVAKAPPVVAAAAAAESGAGGFNWKWLLLLLPLLLAFLFWKGCNGCGNTAVPPPPAVTEPTPTPEPTPVPVDTIKNDPIPDPEPPVPQEVSCNCTGSSNNIFNIPSNGTPKVLTRLGTNPEFGNSHSLDAVGFYNKLKNAHATNNRDKRFLDNLFKAMGYENGFAGADANLFSETRLSSGTDGNMGYSTNHQTVFAKLNAKGKDLEAFKIKAANGCDIHFMKTCGNHFFFCPK
ncbi:MAG: DUF1508 domain-containing protein [Saprospiraceae bacterium]